MKDQREKQFLDSLQIGRAVAALSIVLLHAYHDADRYFPRYTGVDPGFTASPDGFYSILGAGVDIFFVISGVVMVLSTQGAGTSVGTFLYRRAARIFPLWWLLTLAFIAVLLIAPGLFSITSFDPVYATCSMLLIPCIGPDGEAIPFIYAGWTLTYELVFYFLFALSMFAAGHFRKMLVCIVLVLLWHGLHYTPLNSVPAIMHSTGNIMLEFIFGVLLGHLWLSRSFSVRLAIPLLVAGLLLIMASTSALMLSLPRFLQWGIPASCVVAGLMCLNKARFEQGVFYRGLVYLGATSYSLYLFHFFSLKIFFVVLGKTGLLAQMPGQVAVFGSVLVSVAASILVYHVCEQPLQRLTHWLYRRWQDIRPPVVSIRQTR